MKKTPRNLVAEQLAPENTISGCAHASERRPVPYRHLGKEMGERAAHCKENGRHVPLLVTVDKPRCNSADVRAGTDEQEDDEQEGLEVEKRGLRWVPVRKVRQSCLDGKYVERDGPWSC
jgi:hypothetical protein